LNHYISARRHALMPYQPRCYGISAQRQETYHDCSVFNYS